MPRPPVLPALDWRAIFDSGIEFDAWLATADHPHLRDAMAESANQLTLAPQVEAALAALPADVHIVAIAEDWCGDVCRHVPALERINRAAPRLHVRYITREQRPDVFVRYLTNGGEAIPKFIFLNATFTECGNWGPMPEACKELIARGKAAGNVGPARAQVSQLYQADPSLRHVFKELLTHIDIATGA
jgi:hypothetical protein